MKPSDQIHKAKTSAVNYDIDTDAIVARLKQWETLCKFQVTKAGHDTVDIEFDTLPEDMDVFVRDLYEFCPDLVDQGTGCFDEMSETMGETGQELQPEIKKANRGRGFRG